MCADRRAQRGSLLLEFMLVAALGLALAVWAGQEWAQKARVLQAQALAAWMEPVQAAAQAYLRQHAAALQQADTPQALAVEGIADWTAPDWAELQAAGLLPPGWRNAGPLQQTLALRVSRTGACPQSPCRVQALVGTRAGLLRPDGRVDETLVAEWLLAAQGRGLVLWPNDPQHFRGAGRRLGLPPGEPWPSGGVALAADWVVVGDDSTPGGGGDSGDHADFLRVRDARDPDFQGDASARGSVRSGAWLQAQDGLVLEHGKISNTPCTMEGGVGRDDRHAGLLICRQGVWQDLARPAGGGYMLSSRRGCFSATGQSTHNPMTGACSCPSGYVGVQIAESGSLASPEGLSLGFVCQPNRY
ncbi:hypothetical protein [Castellaniella sp.]|uniref:hypothetical protein n=1 Tax=Castellaniella sp. TaxID=1955812 RepID=UPI002AFE3361|nr:hypothetical protein [Castellaniella sp.]